MPVFSIYGYYGSSQFCALTTHSLVQVEEHQDEVQRLRYEVEQLEESEALLQVGLVLAAET